MRMTFSVKPLCENFFFPKMNFRVCHVFFYFLLKNRGVLFMSYLTGNITTQLH